MNIRRSIRVVGLPVTFITAVALALLQVTSVAGQAAEQPEYTSEQRPNGYVRVRVSADFESTEERDRYAARKRTEAEQLARSRAENVPIQVTFARPLTVSEFRTLMQQTNLTASLVVFEARDPNNGLHTVFARATGADVVDTHSLAPLLSPRSLRLIGIAVVQGRVNASGLAQLSAHPAVYIPDITAYRLIPEVAARYGVKPDRVQVTVPTPFWYLSSSRSS